MRKLDTEKLQELFELYSTDKIMRQHQWNKLAKDAKITENWTEINLIFVQLCAEVTGVNTKEPRLGSPMRIPFLRSRSQERSTSPAKNYKLNFQQFL